MKFLKIFCALLPLLGVSACTSPRTQVVIVVDADSTVRVEAASIAVRVETRAGNPLRTFSASDFRPNNVFVPIEIPVSSRSGQDSFLVVAEAFNQAGTRLAVNRARVGFVSGQVTWLSLWLSTSCNCAETQRCVLGDNQQTACTALDVTPRDSYFARDGGLDAGMDGFADAPTSCARGTHLCGETCLPDNDRNSCGTRCSPCPTVSGGTAICEQGSCGVICNGNRQMCGAACIDTQSAFEHCGRCDHTCEGAQVCVDGECTVPPQCDPAMPSTCPPATYCNQGRCSAGCDEDADCGAQGVCNLQTHVCGCANGFLRCGGTCAACPSDAASYACNAANQCVASSCNAPQVMCSGACTSESVTSCGASCARCDATNGVAQCSGGSCGVASCNPGFRLCNGVCAQCPASATTTCDSNGACVASSCEPGLAFCNGQCVTETAAQCGANCIACSVPNGTAQCSQGTCAVAACNPGYRVCSGRCAACPSGATQTTCDGAGACVATACDTSFALCNGSCVANSTSQCGSSCQSCSVAHGTSACVAGTCTTTTCDAGYRLCNGSCAQCPSGATSTSCNSAGACVASSCATGNAFCAGNCVPESTTQCGQSCQSCSAANGTAACNGGSCVVASCNAGYRLCNGACAQCPSNASTTMCNGSGQCIATSCNTGFANCNGSCVANSVSQCGASCAMCSASNGTASCSAGTCTVASCNAGYRLCNGACAQCPSGASSTSCAPNGACVASSCSAGFAYCNNMCVAESASQCGATCQACSVANGTASCSAGSCGIASCNAGYRACGGTCAQCPQNASATTCSGSNLCVATTCNSGFARCSGQCVTESVSQCGASCQSCSVANGTASCTAGVCGVASCNSGYVVSGTACVDVNECLSGNGGCHANATCTNTPGSRTCACNPGYTGNGITCTANTTRWARGRSASSSWNEDVDIVGIDGSNFYAQNFTHFVRYDSTGVELSGASTSPAPSPDDFLVVGGIQYFVGTSFFSTTTIGSSTYTRRGTEVRDDVFLWARDAASNAILWSLQIGGTGYDLRPRIAVSSTSVCVALETASADGFSFGTTPVTFTLNGTHDTVVGCVQRTSGSVLWSSAVSGAAGSARNAPHAFGLQNGELTVAGVSDRVWGARYNPATGVEIGQFTITTSSGSVSNSNSTGSVASNGNIYLNLAIFGTLATTPAIMTSSATVVLALTSAGARLWHQSLSGVTVRAVDARVQDAVFIAGDVSMSTTIAGQALVPVDPGSDPFVARFHATTGVGNYAASWGCTGASRASAIVADASGYFVGGMFAGCTLDFGGGVSAMQPSGADPQGEGWVYRHMF